MENGNITDQALLQYLLNQGGNAGATQPTISKEERLATLLGSLGSGALGYYATKGSGINPLLGGAYGALSTYGDTTQDLLKSKIAAGKNRLDSERIRQMINSKVINDVLNIKKYQGEQEKAPGTIETAEGISQWNPQTRRYDIPIGKGKGGSQNIKTYYQIDKKGNIVDSINLNENNSDSLALIKERGLVPPTDPRILANRQAININLQAGLEGAKTWDKETMQNWAKDYKDSQKEGLGAQTNLARIQAMKTALGEGYQGKLASLKSTVGAYYESIAGQPVVKASETQIAQAIANRIALTMVGAQVEGGGMPANLFSEADREFVVQANANPNLTPEANARLLDLAERTEKFKQLKARAWTEYLTTKGKPDANLYPYIEKRVSGAFGLNQPSNNLTPQQLKKPNVGEIRKGYRFNGGDPANPNSWEKI